MTTGLLCAIGGLLVGASATLIFIECQRMKKARARRQEGEAIENTIKFYEDMRRCPKDGVVFLKGKLHPKQREIEEQNLKEWLEEQDTDRKIKIKNLLKSREEKPEFKQWFRDTCREWESKQCFQDEDAAQQEAPLSNTVDHEANIKEIAQKLVKDYKPSGVLPKKRGRKKKTSHKN